MTEELIRKARELGACPLIDGARDWDSLASLMFTPQGMEFCKEHSFPTLEQFHRIPQRVADRHRTFIGPFFRTINGSCALVSARHVRVVCSKTEEAFTVLLFHGSKAVIEATEYAVVRVVCVGEGNSYTVEGDGTASVI